MANPEVQKTLVERAEEAKEKNRSSADSRFSANPEANIKLLAEKAYAGKQEQNGYAEKIKLSLKAHLKEEVTIEKLWKYLEQKNCQTTAITEGALRFFAGQKGENEISIAEFMKPLRIEATSTLTKTEREMKKEQIESTRSALEALRAEIGAR